jgi:hypothetical protein
VRRRAPPIRQVATVTPLIESRNGECAAWSVGRLSGPVSGFLNLLAQATRIAGFSVIPNMRRLRAGTIKRSASRPCFNLRAQHVVVVRGTPISPTAAAAGWQRMFAQARTVSPNEAWTVQEAVGRLTQTSGRVPARRLARNERCRAQGDVAGARKTDSSPRQSPGVLCA